MEYITHFCELRLIKVAPMTSETGCELAMVDFLCPYEDCKKKADLSKTCNLESIYHGVKCPACGQMCVFEPIALGWVKKMAIDPKKEKHDVRELLFLAKRLPAQITKHGRKPRLDVHEADFWHLNDLGDPVLVDGGRYRVVCCVFKKRQMYYGAAVWKPSQSDKPSPKEVQQLEHTAMMRMLWRPVGLCLDGFNGFPHTDDAAEIMIRTLWCYGVETKRGHVQLIHGGMHVPAFIYSRIIS